MVMNCHTNFANMRDILLFNGSLMDYIDQSPLFEFLKRYLMIASKVLMHKCNVSSSAINWSMC
jgi:hypothetical protein